MSGFKGKPGPWHWEGKVLCNDDHIVGGDCWVFNDADKHLIAAAPDLLEALQRLVKAVNYGTGDELSDAEELAEVAMEKALGNN